jgi:hypothetical protein
LCHATSSALLFLFVHAETELPSTSQRLWCGPAAWFSADRGVAAAGQH